MKQRKVSLKDIAREVGVSVATVSYVLSNRKESRVSEKMAKKIRQVAKDLNYQPNQIAKSLKSGRTFTIGLVVADISNPFFSQIARIIEDEAAKLNYTVIFGSSDEKADRSWGLVQFLMNRQVDGFIIAPTEGSEEQITYLKEHNMPFVLIDRYLPGIPTNYVVIDNYSASHKAVSRLIQTGNDKIAMIAYDTSQHHMQERIRGYKEALSAGKTKPKEDWVNLIQYDNVEEEVRKAIEKLINGPEKIEAIFFATNTLAIHGLKHLSKLGYKIPDDVAVACFDEGEAFDFFYCPITHIRQPLSEMSQQAVKILADHIDNPDKELQHISLPAELIVKKSCGEAVKAG